MIIEHLFISHELNLAPVSVAHELLTVTYFLFISMLLDKACMFLHNHRALGLPDFLPCLVPLPPSLSLPAHTLLLSVDDLLIHLFLDLHVLLENIDLKCLRWLLNRDRGHLTI